MSNRVVKLIMEDGSSFDYNEKKQYKEWEKDAISKFSIDLEEYAKIEYDLIDADDKKDIEDFDDSDILEEAEYRGILPAVAELENENISNADFVDRFVTIINRGINSEIENVLSLLESKYKIA